MRISVYNKPIKPSEYQQVGELDNCLIYSLKPSIIIGRSGEFEFFIVRYKSSTYSVSMDKITEYNTMHGALLRSAISKIKEFHDCTETISLLNVITGEVDYGLFYKKIQSITKFLKSSRDLINLSTPEDEALLSELTESITWIDGVIEIIEKREK